MSDEMTNVSIFEGNPNLKVLTLEIDQDLLGPYSKLVVTPNGALRQYSPIADFLFRGDVTRVDISVREGKTYIGISRKLMEWSDKNKETVLTAVQKLVEMQRPLLLIDALSKNITAQKPFIAENPVQKLVQDSFNEQVNPILASDGGAMELLNIGIKQTGEISAGVALIGSCNGCGFAETETLSHATNRIRQVLEIAKKQYADNPTVQALKFEGISIREVPEIVFVR
jgi:Fe-S cluster biogenesis protein NfuA